MSWQNTFKEILQREFNHRRALNPKYSMRAYALDLDVSVASLSLAFKNRLNFSVERAAAIISQLPLDREERDRALALMGKPLTRKIVQLSASHLFILKDWIYMAVLHFFDLDETGKSPRKIAARLAVDVEKVEEVINELINHGLLERTSSGDIIKHEVHWSVGDGLPSDLVRHHHMENLKVAATALESVPAAQRDFSSITFCGNQTQLENVRREIRELHRRISAIMEGAHPRNEVYRLSVSLFPFNFGVEK